MKGIIFDIKEFALNDGRGIRTTVFMKGCPLRCRWCHNPEGLVSAPQEMISVAGTRIAGTEYSATVLASILKRNCDVFCDTNGGVTFSGGEPLMQADFLVEVISHLEGVHVLLDTCGYAKSETFIEVVSKVSHVFYDLKLINSGQHVNWTGKGNSLILNNLSTLDHMTTPYTIRVPLIPGVTDTRSNLAQIAAVVRCLKNAREIHLLPYNALAGAKYESLGMRFLMNVDKYEEREVPMDVFSGLSIPVRTMGSR
jgi:pyruvate formate lyase activating enzyme